MSGSTLTLLNETQFESDLQSGKNIIPVFKSALENANKTLFELFEQDTAIEELVFGRATFIDKILTYAWQSKFNKNPDSDIALLAVGGYGRGELHPCSDVDILLLLAEDNIDQYKDRIEQFITFLWDIGLEIGSSVRSLDQCVEEARNDITIATNILESRLIYGPDSLFEKLMSSTGPEKIWPSREFFEQKLKEQQQRHARFHDTAYNLEPNIKENPGGLRDIQMIGWIAKRHFGDKTLQDLVNQKFLTQKELTNLLNGQAFLWKVRFCLHMISDRREDRLLFEHQRVVAKQFGYQDESMGKNALPNDHSQRPADGHRLGVEIFMKEYYRTVMELNRLNEMLLQYYQEAILFAHDVSKPVVINKRFRAKRGFLHAARANTFQRYPFALLEVFLLLQQHPEIKGVRASTIRLIRENIHLIDETFRDDIRCKSLFIEIFKQPTGLTHVLRHMNTYGVLAAYVPAFGKIVGQMQFDLFHVYTVDQHTLFVIRNLRRFFVKEFREEFPLCSEIIRTIPKPELLYLAALFHDIAKGRGGDHSVLGESDAREFCLSHGLSSYDANLVSWLVRQHLLMSSTAQHKDLSDPEVIWEFANVVENNIKLDYLYLLTVADMRATNEKVWNSWKDSLLKTLRRQTKYAFQRGLENPLGKTEQIQQTKEKAIQLLGASASNSERIKSLWERLGDQYFSRYRPEDIAKQTKILLDAANKDTVIHVEPIGLSGGTEIFLKTPLTPNLFANSTTALEQLGLNVVEARIVTGKNELAVNTYTVLELNGEPVTEDYRIEEIQTIMEKFTQSKKLEVLTRSTTNNRKIRCFNHRTEISFVDDDNTQRTVMEITTMDHPGLLSRIARILSKNKINITNAKIATLGAQVDDVFYTHEGTIPACVNDKVKQTIEREILEALD